MGLRQWIVPSNRRFFDAFDEGAANAVAASEALLRLFDHYESLAEVRQHVKDLEHKGDQITHRVFKDLGKAPGRPFTHDIIASLAKAIDDVVDAVYDSTNRLFLYGITKPTTEMKNFATILVQQARELQAGLTKVRNAKAPGGALNHCIEVNRLEAEADRFLNDALAALFRGSDAIHILKHKEIYEILETACDRCEDVADILSDVVQKYPRGRAKVPEAAKG